MGLCMLFIAYPLGGIGVAVLTYIIDDIENLLLVVSIVNLVVFIPVLFIKTEPPKWLYKKG